MNIKRVGDDEKMILENQIKAWAPENGYEVMQIENETVYFERLVDRYPMKVAKSLVEKMIKQSDQFS